MNTKQTYNRLLPIFNMIDKSVTCQLVVDNTDGTYTFDCTYTNYAIAGFQITIGLIDYLITDVECNESITVSGISLPTQLTFDLYAPFFKHGGIKRVASELNKSKNFKDKFPLIFLHEVVDEGLHLDIFDLIELDADCRLYFLTPCNFKDWSQEDYDLKAIQPMRNLCNEFIKALAFNQYTGQLTGTGNVKNHTLFGNYNDNGTTKNYFNENLSGVGLKITVPFLKNCDCCETGLDIRSAPGYVYDNIGGLLAILYSNEIYITGTPCAPVTIKNIETGATITTIASGGTYNVEQLVLIEDTITANTTTIIEPI